MFIVVSELGVHAVCDDSEKLKKILEALNVEYPFFIFDVLEGPLNEFKVDSVFHVKEIAS
jgi:hypothetical protein